MKFLAPIRVLVLAGVFVLAGCDAGGGSGTGPSAAPADGLDRAALVDAAKCMRGHGYPDYPDPVERNGRWIIPEPANEIVPAAECRALFTRAKGGEPSRTPATAEQITKLRKWGECMRANNLPDWPDPDSDGVFHVPSRLFPLDDNPAWRAADAACEPLQPGPITIDGGPLNGKNH